MTDNKKLGIKGERFTVRFLKKNKYKILLRNFTSHFGEIDIIAHDDKYIIFVEVKTRSGNIMLPPGSAVNYKKQKRIINTAQYFLRKYKTDLKIRFDIAEVTFDSKRKMKMNYIENAFYNKNDLDIFM